MSSLSLWAHKLKQGTAVVRNEKGVHVVHVSLHIDEI